MAKPRIGRGCGGTRQGMKRGNRGDKKGKKGRGGTRSRQEAKPASKQCGGTHAWNKGGKVSRLNKQHVCVPRDQLALLSAVALWWAGPVYAAILWLALCTSRRISETLLLRGCDIQLSGGTYYDQPCHMSCSRGGWKTRSGKALASLHRLGTVWWRVFLRMQ